MPLTVENTTSSTSTGLTSGYDSQEISDMWLQLLVAQLENQDPLDPMDTEEFTAQLTDISSLEQQTLTNEMLGDVLKELSADNTATFMGMAGDTVTAYGADAPMQDGEVTWYVDLAADASNVDLSVLDSEGREVYSTSISGEAGANEFTWDGVGSDGVKYDDGAFTLVANATNSEGEEVLSEIRFEARVTEVDVTSETAIMYADDVAFYATYIATTKAPDAVSTYSSGTAAHIDETI